MLPAAHVQRVRVQSIPSANADFEQLTTESEQEQQRGNIRNEQHEKRKTLAEACSEATYNSVLNVEALKEAVQQKPSLIVLRATKNGKWEFRISLKGIRRILLAANLIVFATAVTCFAAWSTVNEVKNSHNQIEHHRWINYIDRALFTISIYLMIYYLIFGFVISMFFGAQTDILCIALMCPVILVLSLFLVCISASVLHFRCVFHDNLDILQHHSTAHHLTPQLQKSLCDLHSILDVYGIPFSIMVILSSIVQAGMSVLPWYIYDLPFQRMLDIEDMVIHDMENRQVNNYPRSLTADGLKRTVIEEQTRENLKATTPVKRRPYRSMSSASTVLLELCKPELRQMHRN